MHVPFASAYRKHKPHQEVIGLDWKRLLVWTFARNTSVGKAMLGRTVINEAALQAYLSERQQELNTRTANQRRLGQNIRNNPEVRYDWIGNVRVLCKLYETGDPTRLDVYYGGDGRPDGDGHGHIAVSRGRIVSWLLPAGPNGKRERIV